MTAHPLLSPVAIQIALLRAKCVARRCARRAVELLLAVGLAFEQAARFVAAHLRAAA